MESLPYYLVIGGIALFGIILVPDILDILFEKFFGKYPDDLDKYNLN